MGTGLDAQVGFAEEVTYGTYVAPTRFLEFLSESMENSIDRQESQGLRAGARIQRSGRWTAGKQAVGGNIEFELANKGFGMLFKHMLGAVAIATPGGGTLTRDHTYTPADLTNLALTCQIGKPPVAGAVLPFAYEGCKVSEWEIACAVDEIPKLRLTLLGEEENRTSPLATASYAANASTFWSTAIALSMGGSAIDVKEITISGNNGLADDRFFLGGVKRKNPLEVGLRDYGGSFVAEFENLTQYNRFINGTEASLVVTMTGPLIEGAFNFQITITMNVRVDGETPKVDGPDVLDITIPFKCINTGSGDGTALTLVYRTTDTAI